MQATLQSNAKGARREARLFAVSSELKEMYRKRFWSRVIIKGPKDCWLWTGGIANANEGYGIFGIGRNNIGIAHRVAWALHHNMLAPQDLCVCQSCDNPPCCNPNHLFLANNAINARDRELKGRGVNGKWKVHVVSIEQKKAIILDFLQEGLWVRDIANNRVIKFKTVFSTLYRFFTKVKDKSWLPEPLYSRYAECKSWKDVLEMKEHYAREDANNGKIQGSNTV